MINHITGILATLLVCGSLSENFAMDPSQKTPNGENSSLLTNPGTIIGCCPTVEEINNIPHKRMGREYFIKKGNLKFISTDTDTIIDFQGMMIGDSSVTCEYSTNTGKIICLIAKLDHALTYFVAPKYLDAEKTKLNDWIYMYYAKNPNNIQIIRLENQ